MWHPLKSDFETFSCGRVKHDTQTDLNSLDRKKFIHKIIARFFVIEDTQKVLWDE